MRWRVAQVYVADLSVRLICVGGRRRRSGHVTKTALEGRPWGDS